MEKPRVLILYGSQTGNAQDVAERLGREAKQMLLSPAVMPMDAYNVAQLPNERLLLCVASTTGQGDPPDNMKRFWKFMLRKSLTPTALSCMQFSVFGLGDSNYPKYNVTAKKLFRRLEGLGARPLVPLGLGNDQHPAGYEAALDPWTLSMWPVARQAAGPLPPGLSFPTLDATSLVQLGASKYKVTMLPPSPPSSTPSAPHADWAEAVAMAAAFRRVAAVASGCLPAFHDTPSTAVAGPSTSYGPWRPYFARMLRNQRLTAASHFQDTRHIELDLADSGLSYEPGDVLAVLPRTPAAAVDALLKRLNLDGSQHVCVELADQNAAVAAVAAAGQPAVACGTVRALVQGALDIAGASPRRYFFQVLQSFAKTELEQERLAYFATAEGRDDLYRYNQKEGRTVLEILSDFKTAMPTLEWLLEACPPLAPRLFSISSSLKQHPCQAHLTLAVVEYITPYKRRKRGLCSSYLAASQPLYNPEHINGAAATPGAWAPAQANKGSATPATALQCVPGVVASPPAFVSAQASGAAATAAPTARLQHQIDPASDASLQIDGKATSSSKHSPLHATIDLTQPLFAQANGHAIDPADSSSEPPSQQSDRHAVDAAHNKGHQHPSTADPQGREHAAGCPTPGSPCSPAPVELVALWVERGSLRMPPPHVPLILIGPGTGVAPFRAMLEERHSQLLVSNSHVNQVSNPSVVPLLAATQEQCDVTPAPACPAHPIQQHFPVPTPSACSLFFGCRSRVADFYYAQQWQQLQEQGVLLPPPHGLVVAFSRDQPSKVYVTHKLREHATHVWSMISQHHASVFVSGSAQQMPANVLSALEDIAQEQGRMGKEEATKYVRQLELTGRYCVEAWS